MEVQPGMMGPAVWSHSLTDYCSPDCVAFMYNVWLCALDAALPLHDAVSWLIVAPGGVPLPVPGNSGCALLMQLFLHCDTCQLVFHTD